MIAASRAEMFRSLVVPVVSKLLVLLVMLATRIQSFMPFSSFSRLSTIKKDSTIISSAPTPSCTLLKSSGDMHTAYEYIARQRGPPTSECIQWIDPSQNIISSSTPPKQLEDAVSNDMNPANTDRQKDIDPILLRLPIYPVSAVHLPSSASHTLHNTQMKNIKMARDLEAGDWTITIKNVKQPAEDTESVNCNEGYIEMEKNSDQFQFERKCRCFVLTLYAKDTHRIASIGTMMEVINIKETYTASDKVLVSIVVECRAVDIVHIQGLERGSMESTDDYLIGNLLRLGDNCCYYDRSACTKLDYTHLNKIVRDYASVRSMYVHKDGVASRELPPFARDAVQSNLPIFTEEDFTQQFWNVAECWQRLCNTIREARKSNLQAEMNEIMIDAALRKKGPLQLPVKRKDLPEDVQALLSRIESKENEDFLSCGMDACLDFQVLLGFGLRYKGDIDEILTQRILFLGDLIKREKDRLMMKERLKDMFGNNNATSD